MWRRYTRVSLPYFATEAQLRYVIDAVLFVADHGWKLLPQVWNSYLG